MLLRSFLDRWAVGQACLARTVAALARAGASVAELGAVGTELGDSGSNDDGGFDDDVGRGIENC